MNTSDQDARITEFIAAFWNTWEEMPFITNEGFHFQYESFFRKYPRDTWPAMKRVNHAIKLAAGAKGYEYKTDVLRTTPTGVKRSRMLVQQPISDKFIVAEYDTSTHNIEIINGVAKVFRVNPMHKLRR